MKNTDNPSVEHWIRWKGVGALLGLATLGGIYLRGWGDLQLKNWLEGYASQLNGAQVSIGSLSTSLFNSQVEIRDLRVADHVRPRLNLFEVERIAFTFLPGPLLAKKWIIPDLTIEGIRYRTPRESSGLLSDQARAEAGPSVFDRIETGLYADLKSTIGENPLRRLGPLSTGLALPAQVDRLKNELASPLALQSVGFELVRCLSEWDRHATSRLDPTWVRTIHARLKTLPGRAVASVSASEKIALIAELKAKHQDLLRQQGATLAALNQLDAQLARLDVLAEKDVLHIRQSLGLPEFERGDLTGALFGPKALNYLGRLYYWLDLSRRRMPKGSKQGQLSVSRRSTGSASSFHFGKNAAYPTFLLRRGQIRSALTSDAYRGNVRGTVESISTDPYITREPTRIQIEADFPPQGVSGIKAQATIDHTGENDREDISVSVDSLSIAHWMLHETSDLSFAVESARVRLNFAAKFREQDLESDWHAQLRDVDYSIVSRYSQLETALRRAADPMREITLVGGVRGPLSALSFKIESPFGKTLSAALGSEFRHPIGAIEDGLRRDLLDKLDVPRRQLAQKLQAARLRIQEDPAPKTVKNLLSLAEKPSEGSAR